MRGAANRSSPKLAAYHKPRRPRCNEACASKSSLERHQPAEYWALKQGKWQAALNAKDYLDVNNEQLRGESAECSGTSFSTGSGNRRGKALRLSKATAWKAMRTQANTRSTDFLGGGS